MITSDEIKLRQSLRKESLEKWIGDHEKKGFASKFDYPAKASVNAAKAELNAMNKFTL